MDGGAAEDSDVDLEMEREDAALDRYEAEWAEAYASSRSRSPANDRRHLPSGRTARWGWTRSDGRG
eukprot:12945782-Alexandrium_andersonii.AAC.1